MSAEDYGCIGPRANGSRPGAPVRIRGYPDAQCEASQCGIKEPCVWLRGGSLAETTWGPPGLALLASDYKCGSSELALVSKWVGPLDQRPSNELYGQATAELYIEGLANDQAATELLSVAA